jgi:hypothetical protein
VTAAVAVSRKAVSVAASLALRIVGSCGLGSGVLSALISGRLLPPELPRCQKSDHFLLWTGRRSVVAGDMAVRNVT